MGHECCWSTTIQLVSMNTAYMLMDLGHSVLEVTSGAQALRILETIVQFDVVVTDYAMPGMSCRTGPCEKDQAASAGNSRSSSRQAMRTCHLTFL